MPLIASDVDGTLTSSEKAYWETIALGTPAGVQPGAPAAYRAAAARGYQLVYVTARGNQSTETTRQWLESLGFPRGPLRLAPSFVTLPGSDTVDYKTSTLSALASELPLVMGVGNRASDVTAYTNVGLASDAIFVKLPEYTSELQAPLAAGEAIGFDAYSDLQATAIAALPARP